MGEVLQERHSARQRLLGGTLRQGSRGHTGELVGLTAQHTNRAQKNKQGSQLPVAQP